MQNIQASAATSPNPKFVNRPRAEGEDNLQWLAAGAPKKGSSIVLFGGVDNHAFRLRVAQAHVRDTFTPSHWSHAVLLFGIDRNDPGATRIYEISLAPQRGFGFPASMNALQEGMLGHYVDPAEFPNVAIINFPLTQADIEPVLYKFTQQRAVLDAVDLVIRWLAFGWGVAGSGNPLLDGYGLPSAAMLEVVCNAAGYDITPNTPSRASSPEAIWQATKWWWEYPRLDKAPPEGSWTTPHQLGDQGKDAQMPVLAESMRAVAEAAAVTSPSRSARPSRRSPGGSRKGR